jgi:hypothetical protein
MFSIVWQSHGRMLSNADKEFVSQVIRGMLFINLITKKTHEKYSKQEIQCTLLLDINPELDRVAFNALYFWISCVHSTALKPGGVYIMDLIRSDVLPGNRAGTVMY